MTSGQGRACTCSPQPRPASPHAEEGTGWPGLVWLGLSWGGARGSVPAAQCPGLPFGKQVSQYMPSAVGCSPGIARPGCAVPSPGAAGGWGRAPTSFYPAPLLPLAGSDCRHFILCVSSLQAALVHNITTGERLIRTLQGEFHSLLWARLGFSWEGPPSVGSPGP